MSGARSSKRARSCWGINMEEFIVWWCGLIGVTDQEAIHIAIGIAAGGSLYLAVVNVLGFLAAILSAATR